MRFGRPESRLAARLFVAFEPRNLGEFCPAKNQAVSSENTKNACFIRFSVDNFGWFWEQHKAHVKRRQPPRNLADYPIANSYLALNSPCRLYLVFSQAAYADAPCCALFYLRQ